MTENNSSRFFWTPGTFAEFKAPPPPQANSIQAIQANSQTNDCSETGEAAFERSRRGGSKALLKFFLKGHVSGQSQVKGKN